MGLVILLAIGLALLIAAMILYTARTLTCPPRRTYANAVARGRPGDPSELASPHTFDCWSFRSGRHEFPVWDVPCDNPDGPVVILIHGWADSRIGGLARLPFLSSAASRVILWDLRGHGDAPDICRLGTAEVDDVTALIDHLQLKAPPVLFGWSLGAGVALAAASRAAAVIAESPYRFADTPARNVIRARGLPWQLTLQPALALLNLRFGGRLSRSRFDRARLAMEAPCPILILHGELDEVCPIEDGRDIAAAAHARLAVIPNGHHNDLWTDPDLAARCAEHVQVFLEGIQSPVPVGT